MTSQEKLTGFCAKDNREVDMAEGCRHPHDYCQYRNSCLIHFMEQERRRDAERAPDNYGPA